MIPWELLGTTQVPGGGGELRLYRRGEEFSIRVDGAELMNSRVHGSEDALADLACSKVKDRPDPRVLIGGLGMGYTMAAALGNLGETGQVVVAELVPMVVEWNRGPLSHLAGHPLRDPRGTVRVADVAQVLKSENRAFDAIMLDVDNGPDGLTREDNDWIYTLAGLSAAFSALKPGGVLTVWSAAPDQKFTQRLKRAGFKVEEVRVRARGCRKGSRHTIWVAEAGR